jgi:trehalose/maltose transport system substrate-binding protein
MFRDLRARRFFVPPALALLALICLGSAARSQVQVAISCSSLGIEQDLCRKGAEAWARATGNSVKLVPTPANADERFTLYSTLFGARSPEIDVFQIDIVWPGAFASHLIGLGEALKTEDRGDHLDILITNNTVDGRLVALPFFVDAGLLYYRKDLLEKYRRAPPTTWAELAETARIVADAERGAGQADMQGFVWQGRAYEGLVCNAMEWIASHGGVIIDADGKVAVDFKMVAVALAAAHGWIGTISPAGVLNYAEEDARSAFQSGKAVFMRNWPYAWALANEPASPVAGKVGVAPLPKGEGPNARHAATLGGQQLAVSRYSRHPREATDLVVYLTSKDEQKRRALAGSFNPTRRSLYEDGELLRANPLNADFVRIIDGAVIRPSTVTGAQYNRVSSQITQAVHDTLSGRGSAEDNLGRLSRDLKRLSRDGRWR